MTEKQGVLFSAEEMNRIEKENLWNQPIGPVTVLGMTFENDEERRKYFREELRKRLPELRKIEGFPIGADEDIINLSDPPYYTACPNPWLNDFIDEWEKEKAQLQSNGKRKADFEVKEPYASDVSEGKNNPIYMAHTYHTKVPHPAVMRYIMYYTQPGDIIYDGFAGTGMTGVAAQSCIERNDDFHNKINTEFTSTFGLKPNWGVRHALCGDLSPYASTIAYNYNTYTETKAIKMEGLRILKVVEEKCSWMYETNHNGKSNGTINCLVWSEVMRCPNCGKSFTYWDVSMDHTEKKLLDDFKCPGCGSSLNKKNVERVFETKYDESLKKTVNTIKVLPIFMVYTVNGKRFSKRVDDSDIKKITDIENTSIAEFYPVDELPVGYNTEQPKRTQGYYYISQFYTKRNLATLSVLYDEIKKSKYSNKLLFIFTGIVVRSTQMNRMQINYYFNGGGGWCSAGLKGTLYIPHFPIEISVIEQAYSKLKAYIEASEILKAENNNALYVSSAEKTTLPDNSIDYIFTDPPFGANINYSELNFIPEAWLKVKTNNNTEAVENTAQNKDANFYYSEMQKCFREYYRVLKPGKWMTVEFSNTKARVWNFIQNSITSVGFVIVNVASLDKKQGSYKSLTTPTAVKQDLVITCYKPSNVLTSAFESSGKVENVWTFIHDYLEHLPIHLKVGTSTSSIIERSPKILYDRIISYYVQHGYQIPMDAQEFQAGLRERFIERDGMYFTPSQAAEYEEKRKHTTDFVPMGLIVSDEANGIEWLKLQLKEPKTYQDISPEWMQAVNGLRKGDVMPELRDILEENFIEDETGHWHVPDLEKQIDLEKLKHKSLMKEFNLYKEMAQKPRARIKEVRVEALREGFKQCFKDKDFTTILLVGDKIPQNILTEDEQLLQYYDIAQMRA